MEDMVQDGKSSITEAVVIGPGQTVLFYGSQSLGEGLSLYKVWHTLFMLSGAIGWVGKQAQLNANPVSLGEGQQLIAQAITEQCIKPRGPRFPCSILPASSPVNFCSQDQSPWQQVSQLLLNNGRCPDVTLGHCTRNKAENYKKAETEARGNENDGLSHRHHLHPCQIMGLRVTKVQCQLPHQCH